MPTPHGSKKGVNVTIRVPAQLHDAFLAACQSEELTAIRAFMRRVAAGEMPLGILR